MYYGGPYSHNPFSLGQEFSFELIVFLVLFSIIIVFMVCVLPLLIKWLMTTLLTAPTPTPSVCVCPESHQAPVTTQWLQDQLCASHMSIDIEEFVTPCSTPPVQKASEHECRCDQQQDKITVVQAGDGENGPTSLPKSSTPSRRFARSLGCLTDERVNEKVRNMRADLAPLEMGGWNRFARKKKKRMLEKVREEDEKIEEEEKDVEKKDEVVDEEEKKEGEKKEEKEEENNREKVSSKKENSKTEQESEPQTTEVLMG
ncbi:hypothetical protein PRIPAC_93447 [Pristionchus pacificus]|uniref:Uncharacterized protein n=1 Tax=Pristionchus pacificus TaxID=54126 RepID=A0A454XQ69_PRIPA|nr:hypothetical protein PRIPAC_93447 [Pristionchus pacificus]|eukprot:PDM63038.1 hypothetical protein PRIPAC_50253 [Pristionchus pacificus]